MENEKIDIDEFIYFKKITCLIKIDYEMLLNKLFVLVLLVVIPMEFLFGKFI
jgi:hypothetical protein